MKLLHVISDLSAQSGGPAKAVVEMAAATARRGHRVKIYTTDFGGETVSLTAAQDAGVEIAMHSAEFPLVWKRSPSLARALEHEIPNNDIVHLSALYLYHDWVTGQLCARYRVPYLVQPHGVLDPYLLARGRWKKAIMNLAFQNRVLRNAAAILYTAEEERVLAEPHVQGAPAIVAPLGLDLAGYRALPSGDHFRQKFPETGRRPIVLFLSRLHKKKGLDLLLPAFADLIAAGHDLQLVIAGPDDGMLESVRRWTKSYDLSGRVTLTGMLLGKDKLAAFAAASLFVLPSYSENFGIAVIEALACGLPVVISDKINIWREIEASGAGLVVPSEQDALSQMLKRFFSDEDLQKRLLEAAKPAAESYDWTQVGGLLEASYQSVLNGTVGKRN